MPGQQPPPDQAAPKPDPKLSNPRLIGARVYIGMPTYDERVHQSATILKRSASAVVGRAWALHIEGGSLLARNFNKLLAAALNERGPNAITHFCLIHEDVHPLKSGWLDDMLHTMDEVKADVLGTVIPIKDHRGLTSTAIEFDGPTPAQRRIKRLTMHEVMALPETFTEERLLLNTGLMLIDIRKPWIESLYFQMVDTIIKDEAGKFVAAGCSEDWDFSRRARAAGAVLYATRAIPVLHRGHGEWLNTQAWGSIKKDTPDLL